MKVVILCSSDSSGGAAIASYRLHNALVHYGVETSMMVRHKLKNDVTIVSVHQPEFFRKKEIHPRFVLEKLFFIPFEKTKKERFAFSTGIFGFPLHKQKEVLDADVIHLHWINGGFLSLNGLEKITKLGKPIVWTLHDMWPFTGGCHYSGSCMNYKTGCGNCPMLKKPSSSDLSADVFKKKYSIYRNYKINVVACSQWLAGIARDSSLFGQYPVTNIPNPIDQSLFYPADKLICRNELGLDSNRIYLLFAAGNVLDERKGFQYLMNAMQLLSSNADVIKKVELLVMGKANTALTQYFSVPVNYLGQVSGIENIRRVYCAADAFLLPSLQDNLPNTIMESMACGTPVIAFRTGGVPEMIDDRKTGFLAEERSSDSFADGIRWVIENNNNGFTKPCVDFVTRNYGESIVASRYLQLYESILNNG